MIVSCRGRHSAIRKAEIGGPDRMPDRFTGKGAEMVATASYRRAFRISGERRYQSIPTA